MSTHLRALVDYGYAPVFITKMQGATSGATIRGDRWDGRVPPVTPGGCASNISRTRVTGLGH